MCNAVHHSDAILDAARPSHWLLLPIVELKGDKDGSLAHPADRSCPRGPFTKVVLDLLYARTCLCLQYPSTSILSTTSTLLLQVQPLRANHDPKDSNPFLHTPDADDHHHSFPP